MRWWLVLIVGCGGTHEPPPLRTALWDAVVIDTPPGMSDLTLDDHRMLWAIAERDRVAVEMNPDGSQLRRHAITGVPDGIDTEAIASLGDGKFVIGYEGGKTAVAGIYTATLEADRLVATPAHELYSEELGVQLIVNHGVEGVCAHGDDVIAAIETVGKFADGTRWAPLAWWHDGVLVVKKLRLTSDVGKISALACTFRPDGTIDLRAVERHYKVSRIVRATLSAREDEVKAVVDIDLEPVLHDSLNIEGLVVLPDGRYEAINDNQGSKVSGPTELLVFHPR
jgi:SdiA-regulated protein